MNEKTVNDKEENKKRENEDQPRETPERLEQAPGTAGTSENDTPGREADMQQDDSGEAQASNNMQGEQQEETQPEITELSLEQAKELLEKAMKADEYYDRFLRQKAEFDNFRKRSARERQEAVKYANQALLEKLLPILDNFEMAISAAGNADTQSNESLRQGVEMILNQLQNTLSDAGLVEVDAQDQMFDPRFHEAVAQHETDEVEEGKVAQQLRKGYMLGDRLVRPASVVVAKKPSE
ncbi:MAG: nucleotide exchange factor GrpE [Verrucomicrobia bacterium]|nr:nucleotide exchange factor GrpE [Verrucomicrobiota bacterium]